MTSGAWAEPAIPEPWIRSPQKPFSALWNVTRSMVPANATVGAAGEASPLNTVMILSPDKSSTRGADQVV